MKGGWGRYLSNGITIILARSTKVEFVSQLQWLVFAQLGWPVEQNIAIYRKTKADVSIAQAGHEAAGRRHSPIEHDIPQA